MSDLPGGSFVLGGDLPVARMGFGAMRVTGPGIWWEPADRAEALRTLRRAPELGVSLIDTADSYGPEVSERLLCEALHPYTGLVIATKGGLTRSGPGQWAVNGDPRHLREAVAGSLRRLRVARIELWQLHRIDGRFPADEQFAAIAEMRREGMIRHVGLSNVTIGDIEAASRYFPVATVQNRYNLLERTSEDVLAYCASRGIGFLPWYPLAAGGIDRAGRELSRIGRRHQATAGQVALAWLLQQSPAMLPIPGTGKVAHLEENVAAAAITLDDADLRTLDGIAHRR